MLQCNKYVEQAMQAAEADREQQVLNKTVVVTGATMFGSTTMRHMGRPAVPAVLGTGSQLQTWCWCIAAREALL